MSTSIDIIPVDSIDISFGDVLTESENQINHFLKSIDINKTVKLSVNIHDNNESYVNTVKLSDKFNWKESEYAWFTINGIIGGTDGNCDTLKSEDIDPDNPWWRLEIFESSNSKISNIRQKLDQAKKFNRLWNFRRSAGQPGIIALSYGLISGSIAKLTNGILWSDDGAWDNKFFPIEANEFLKYYFRPETASTNNDAEWSQECIDSIKEEIVH
jgi:hypothetical protein